MILIGSGGIGNQLFCLAQSLRIYEISKRKVFLITDNREFANRCYELDVEKKSDNAIQLYYLPRTHVFLQKCIGFLENFTSKYPNLKVFMEKRVFTFRKGWDSPSEDQIKKFGWGTFFIRGYFQNPELLESLSENCLQILQGLVEGKEIDSEFTDVLGCKTLGVHIRGGDYHLIPWYGILSPQYFNSCIEEFRQLNPNKSVKLVVSSDEIRKVSAISGGSFVTFLSPQIFSAFQTMQLLCRTSYFVMSNSTFSFWIGWVVIRRGGRVVAPSPWFKGSPVPENYLYLPQFQIRSSIFD